MDDKSSAPVVKMFTVGPFQVNSYLLGCPETGDAVFIDPGDEVDRLLQGLEMSGLTLKRIINTHAHIDHIAGVTGIQEQISVPFSIHRDEEETLGQAPLHAQLFGLSAPGVPRVDGYLEEGDSIDVGRLTFQVLLVPGHSPGHTVFVGHGIAFTGDTLFAGSIGRTDLPGGDPALLVPMIREKLLTLPGETVVYPGHMQSTTIGEERANNPFLRGR